MDNTDKMVKSLEILAVAKAGKKHTSELQKRSTQLCLESRLLSDSKRDTIKTIEIAAEMAVISRLMNECLEISKECEEAAKKLVEES